MNKYQNETLIMLQVVSAYFDENQLQITAALPAFAAQRVEFESILQSIYQSSSDAQDDITGHAADKSQVRQELREALLRTGRAGMLYYTHALPDERMAERLRMAMRIAGLRTDATLLVNATTICQVCEGIKTLLLPYGQSAADVDGFALLISSFEAVRTGPREARSQSRRQRQAMVSSLNQARTLLHEIMDPMLSILQSAHPLLYGKYKAARKLRKTGGRRAADKPFFSRIKAGTAKALNRADKIEKAENSLRLSSHTAAAGGTLIIYFAASEAEPPAGTGLALAPGQKLNTTAGALGFSAQKPLLMARNDGHTPHTVGLIVGKE